jgi:hypothetical protein
MGQNSCRRVMPEKNYNPFFFWGGPCLITETYKIVHNVRNSQQRK